MIINIPQVITVLRKPCVNLSVLYSCFSQVRKRGESSLYRYISTDRVSCYSCVLLTQILVFLLNGLDASLENYLYLISKIRLLLARCYSLRYFSLENLKLALLGSIRLIWFQLVGVHVQPQTAILFFWNFFASFKKNLIVCRCHVFGILADL